ncbi:MAG: pyridoxamine 5'-phosphate oxidase family protein [Candidatus Dormibacteraceae bacterium]
MTEARTTAERAADVRALLAQPQTGWLSTASPKGRAHLIGSTVWWREGQVVSTTVGSTRTARNLRSTRHARLALGSTEDATLLDLEVLEVMPVGEARPELADGFAAAAGWDPREISSEWVYVTFRPTRIQAYRGYDEIEGSDVLREGRWLA